MAFAPALLATVMAATSVTWLTANSVATGDQDNASIATNRNGYVAVVWEDDRDSTSPTDNSHSDVFLRLYRNGVSQYEINLSGGGDAGTSWKHLSPDVGLDDRGNAVVVWADDPDGNGYFNIPYRVVAPTGAILASGRANANADGDQILPKVGVDPDGTAGSTTAVGFTVVWEDVQGTATTIRAAGYTNVTTKAYEVVASHATGGHHRPDVAVPASGDALVVWDEDADGNGSYNVGLVKLARANGAVTLSRRLANAIADGQQRRAAVASNAAGAFTVAWESDHTGTNGIWTRSFAANAAARHSDAAVSSGSGAILPSTGIDDLGNVVVGWTVGGTNPDVWVRGFNPNGTGAGRLSAQRLSQVTAGRQEQLVVAVSPQGEVPVAYTDDNDGNLFDQVALGLGATNSETAPTVPIQPIGWWENRYREDMAWNHDHNTTLSRSSDSWDYYELAYGIDDATAMYLASGNTEYLEQALFYATNVVDRARISSSLGSNAYGDSFYGWVSNLNGSTGEEVPLYESYCWRYVTRLLRVIHDNSTLLSAYQTTYQRLLTFSEVNIFDKWYTRSVEDNIYRQNTHMASHWAFITMDLSRMVTNATRLARVQQVFDNINNHLPNYNNASLHGQMITSPVNSGAYFWNWDWGQFSRPGSDVSHGNGVMAYVVEAHGLGLGGWTSADMAKFVVTFRDVIWRTTGDNTAAYVDGTGSDVAWFIDGWMKLGRYDTRIQQKLETHTVSSSHGNGALNAKLLGAPYH